MELNIRPEGIFNQGAQPRINNNQPSPFSASPQANQADPKKSKAESERQTVNEQETIGCIEQMNRLMELFNRDLRFEMHKEANVIKISVVDRNDGKVIKQIPPDSVLDMIAKIRDMLGSLMDVKA